MRSASILALVMAVPLAVCVALFISHYAPKRLAGVIALFDRLERRDGEPLRCALDINYAHGGVELAAVMKADDAREAFVRYDCRDGCWDEGLAD